VYETLKRFGTLSLPHNTNLEPATNTLRSCY